MAIGTGNHRQNVDISAGDFRSRLQHLRGKANLTKTELADRAQLAYRTIHDIELGKRGRVQEKTLRLIAEALGVTFEELLDTRSPPREGSLRLRANPVRLRVWLLILGTFLVVIVLVSTVVVIVKRAIGERTAELPSLPSNPRTSPLLDFTEDFEDTSFTYPWVDESTCGELKLDRGRLILNKHQGCQGSAVAMLQPEHVLRGDFDIQVDFELEVFDYNYDYGVRSASLRLFRADNNQLVAGIERNRRFAAVGDCAKYLDEYKLYSDNAEDCESELFPSSTKTGRFRIVRRGSEFREYFWESDGWYEGFRRPLTADDLRFRLSTGSPENRTRQRVTFDNLAITTAVSCLSEFNYRLDISEAPSLWTKRGEAITESGGRIVFTRPDGYGPSVEMRLDPAFVVCGDFDIQIEFELLDFPPISNSGGRYHSLGIADAATRADYLTAERIRRTADTGLDCENCYKFFTDDSRSRAAVRVPTDDIQGKLRVTREGSTVRGFYWADSGWIEAMKRNMPLVDVTIVLYSGTSGEVREGHVAVFGNLLVETR